MAAIREEYILADKFSAGFNRLLRFLDQASKASTVAASSQADFAKAAARSGTLLDEMAASSMRTANAVEAIQGTVERMAEASERAAKSQDKHNNSMRQGASAADNLGRRLLSMAGAYVSLRSAQAAIDMADTFTQTTARLERMNDGLQDTAELQNMIYQAAQRSRGAYQDTADMVAKLGTLAPDAFNSSGELVAFAEQINKQFALAGTSAQGAQAAMLQLTQAMASGVLRGEELNSVLEQAPTITQAIARHLDINIGQLREMASTGQITADVVKSALFAAADETNAAFERIPLTFGQAWTMAANAASRAFEPAMKRMTDLLNSDLGKSAVNGLISGFELLGSMATGAIDLMATGAQWVADNWDTVSVVLQFAGGAFLALAAMSVWSAASSAGAWAKAHLPIVLFTAVVGSAIMAMYAMGATSEEVFSKIGAVAGALYTFGYNLVASAWNLLASFGELFANFLDSPARAVAHLLADLADFALSVLQNIAGAIDAVFGGNLAGAVNGWRNNVQDWANSIAGEKRVQIERMALLDVHTTMAQWASAAGGLGSALDHFSVGDVLGNFGQSGFDYIGLMANSGISGQLAGIGADTSAIRRSVSMAEEDIKLMADMAERRYVNNINLTSQTPVITINGQNTGDTEADLQWLEDSLRKLLTEQLASHTSMSY